MKAIKSIGLFFLLSWTIFSIGFLGGMLFSALKNNKENRKTPPEDQMILHGMQEDASEEGTDDKRKEEHAMEESKVEPFAGFLDAASLEGILGFDTEYVVEEMDVLKGTVMETSLKLPEKYIGMDRERFLKAMDTYASSPPLSELERGFVGLEVKSFSRQKVVVQMNYRYVQPGESFYLALIDHQVVVYLEDQKTVYIYTGISSNMLSEELREELMTQMVHVEDESSLYDFLEAYTS